MAHNLSAVLSHAFATHRGGRPLVLESLDSDTINDSLTYLIGNGLKQSLADAIAGDAKLAKEAWEADSPTKAQTSYLRRARETYKVHPEHYDDADSFANALCAAMQDERLAKIIAGEMTLGGTSGPRLKGIDATMRDVVVEILTAKAKAKGVKIPDTETMRGLVKEYLTKNEASVRAEAERRMALLANADDDDDIFAGLGK